jgi:hypothetical protein
MDVIGLDIGRSAIKGAANGMRLFGLPMLARPPKDEQWRRAGTLDRVIERDGLRHLESLLLTYDGQEWLVGEYGERVGLPAMHVMTVDKADESTRVLALAALVALDAPVTCRLCVGLPLHGYLQQGQVLSELLRGEHRVGVGDRNRVFLLKGMVVPEGLGLWARAASPEGATLDGGLLGLPTVVLDFGHRTIQVSAFQGSRLVAQPYVSAHGVYEVWEAALIEAFEGPSQTVFESPQRAVLMSEMLRDGELSVRGSRLTFDEFRPCLLRHAGTRWERLRSEMSRALAGVQYRRVVAGGGGVTLFSGLLRDVFGDQMVVLEDRFAQAEGYRLIAQHQAMIERV